MIDGTQMPIHLFFHCLVLKLDSKFWHLLIRHPLMLVIVHHLCGIGVDAIVTWLGVEFGWIVELHGIHLNPLIGNHLTIVEFRRVVSFDCICLHSL
jgi:hypothetical protein